MRGSGKPLPELYSEVEMDQKVLIEKYIYEKYKVKPICKWAKYPMNETFSEEYSGKWFALILNVERRRLGLEGEGTVNILNVKADSDMIMLLADTKGYMPAYHMNKLHWLTILLDGTLGLEQIKAHIDESYRRIADTPSRRIYEAVKRIPKGQVATYGQVAELAGDRKMARAVGNALHKNPDPQGIPCFRVVNAKGELSGEFAFGGKGAQERLLIADGVEVKDGRVDLEKYGISLERL